MKTSLKTIGKNSSKIASDIQSLSHQLHSSVLDYLGVAAAVRGFCEEFSKQHKVSVEFSAGIIPEDLSRDISLCLFRVAQEALHNAVKYSGVSRFVVRLGCTDDKIQLMVKDTGAGFDVEESKKKGLGLISMQERVHLVHGRFLIESTPREGTQITVAVPLVAAGVVVLDNPERTKAEGVAGLA
jgi:signal transduction histidine kinase